MYLISLIIIIIIIKEKLGKHLESKSDDSYNDKKIKDRREKKAKERELAMSNLEKIANSTPSSVTAPENSKSMWDKWY